MRMLKSVILLFMLIIFKSLDEANGNCLLSLDKDFGQPSPVFIQDGGFLTPGARGVAVRRGGTVLVGCPGDRRHVVLGNNTQNVDAVEAICVANTTFKAGSWTGHFKDIRCDTQPWVTAEDSKQTCHGGHKLYKVGYRIRKEFYSLYTACFDSGLLTTLYVEHQLTPASRYSQTGSRRPSFVEGSLYGKVRMSQLYKKSNQQTRLNELLGADMDQKYITKNQFLTRGHLAPNADFSLRATQRASFHYVNTSPQWMRGNAGDWAALEDAVRRRVHTLNTTLAVYTGTHGVSTLPNQRGTDTELYLTTDVNGNYVVPVPLYFYKVVYDPRQKSAAAFVLINSSYYNKTRTDSLQFCDDVCEGDSRYSWLRWRSDDTHSFCCEYTQFADKIKELPRLDVGKLFY